MNVAILSSCQRNVLPAKLRHSTVLKLVNLVVEFTETAVDLGVMLNGQLSMSRQVAAVCRSCFYLIRNAS